MRGFRTSLLGLGAFIVLLVAPTLGAVVQWTVAEGGNGHWYEAVAVPGGITWTDAQNAAVATGGYLATITSDAENNFVYNLVRDDMFWVANTLGHWEGPWLGGYQLEGSLEPDGGWTWVTGEPWTYWAPNSVSVDNGPPINENRLEFFYKWPAWNDLGEHGNPSSGSIAPVAYVVESTVPEPATLIVWSLLGVLGISVAEWRRRKRAA